DGSFRFCRWRTHTEALSEATGPEALSTQGQYFALHVFYEILKHITGELSANCCRTITMTRYSISVFAHQWRHCWSRASATIPRLFASIDRRACSMFRRHLVQGFLAPSWCAPHPPHLQ